MPVDVQEDEPDDDKAGQKDANAEADPLHIQEEGAERANAVVPSKGVEEIFAEIARVRSNEEYPDPDPYHASRDRDEDGRNERDDAQEEEESPVTPWTAAEFLSDPLHIGMSETEVAAETTDNRVLQLVTKHVIDEGSNELAEIAEEHEPDEEECRPLLELSEKACRRHNKHGWNRRDHLFGERTEKRKKLKRNDRRQLANTSLNMVEPGKHEDATLKKSCQIISSLQPLLKSILYDAEITPPIEAKLSGIGIQILHSFSELACVHPAL